MSIASTTHITWNDAGVRVINGVAEKQEPVAWTEREKELIDGMIEVQLEHARRCDNIANRTMAEKQKGWDMERVALLQKIKATPPAAQRQWVGLTDEELIACSVHARFEFDPPYVDKNGAKHLAHYEIQLGPTYKNILDKLKEKNT